MDIPSPEHMWPLSPREYLAHWSFSRGNTRHLIENIALRPLDAAAQKDAGEAAAAHAASTLYGLNLEEFGSGLDSVSGALEIAQLHNLADTPSKADGGGEPRVAAFFDIDNTLIQGSSLIAMVFGLAKRKYFRLSEIMPVAWTQLKYRLTGFENANDVDFGRNQALEFVRGRTEAEIHELCIEVMESSIAERIWPGTQRLAEAHLEQGHEVWLVSATPVQLAQEIAKHLGFTGALGTVAEVENGRFTGRLMGDILHGEGKRHAVAALAALSNLDLSSCYAYSDSFNDIPMLSMVGTACAVNPDHTLAKEAKRRGWKIYDFRSIRKAVRTYGLPTLITAGFSVGGWKAFGRSRKKSGKISSRKRNALTSLWP